MVNDFGSYTMLLIFKGTSRGPEPLNSHMNDSYYANVFC